MGKLLFYTKSDRYTFNVQHTPYEKDYLDRDYRRMDPDGRRYRLSDLSGPGGEGKGNPSYEVMGVTRPWRYSRERMEELISQGHIVQTRPGAVPQYKRYLDEMPGVPMQNIWTDMPGLNNRAKEYLGYPTQKPVRLLERIIKTSTNEGDVVFDPFCGCGTTIYAAHLNKRKWIGCDIAIWSVSIIRSYLSRNFGLEDGKHYKVDGVPLTVEGAQELFSDDPQHFQEWIVEAAGGFVNSKRSSDRGVDGRIWWETPKGPRHMVISVKGGKLTPAYVRELHGTLRSEPNAELGGFLCLQEPTRGIVQAAADAGMFTFQDRSYERIQVRTVADVLAGRLFDTPSRVRILGWQQQGVLAL